MIQIITSIRNIRSDLNIPYKEKISLNINTANKDFIVLISSLKKEVMNLLKLEKFDINNSSYKSKDSVNLVIANSTLIIPLNGIINTKEELIRLSEKKNKEQSELNKLLNKFIIKLYNTFILFRK